MESTAELVTGSKRQLAGTVAHLQKLWSSVRSASLVIQQATIAYNESRSLLEQIDGVPSSPMLGDIRVPEAG
jgi:hypothetical protein